MTAEDMFKALGYECRKSENAIQYLSECGKEITFILELHRFYKQLNFISLNIDVDEFKAIQQQMKELGWLEEEKKTETNFEHFFEYLSTKRMSDFALIDGRVTQCVGARCSKCKFNDDCIEGKFTWLKQPYEKPTYKLTQFEYDLLQIKAIEAITFKNMVFLTEMKEKGYFKGIDENAKIEDILESCEVIEIERK